MNFSGVSVLSTVPPFQFSSVPCLSPFLQTANAGKGLSLSPSQRLIEMNPLSEVHAGEKSELTREEPGEPHSPAQSIWFHAPALTLHSGHILTPYRSQSIKADHLTDNRTFADERGPRRLPCVYSVENLTRSTNTNHN